ncbi:hypothetical protein GCM10009665_45500 [Kitasatospora nipponensis]|uniref:Mobilization protein MobC n=1 Tax=Kitasatospora nipponensis TaxID=258049 RepID=A0ABP4H417_9ACTN
MTGTDQAATTPGPEGDRDQAPGGASCRIGYPKGLSKANALAQGCEDGSAGPRARAPRDRQSLGHQGAPGGGEAPADPATDSPPAREPAFPDRQPRRRRYQPTHREDVIAARLKPDEKAEITAAAKRAGLYPSGYLATAALAAARGSTTLKNNEQLDAAIDELAALRAAISRVGNNINQIAYVYNAGGHARPGELDHILGVLTRILASVDDTATSLVKKRT